MLVSAVSFGTLAIFVKLGYRTIRLRREWIDLWAEKHATPAE